MKSKKHLFGYISVIFLIIIIAGYNANANIFLAGEELEYEVSFLGIKLGTIVIISEGIQQNRGKELMKAKSVIKSNEGIPFVGLHTIFESWIDSTISYSHKFIGNSKFMSDTWSYQEIYFDYQRNRIVNEKWENKQLISSDTLKTRSKWNDGLSLFFLARQYLNSNKSYRIPTFMGDDTAYTSLNFVGKKENIKISSLNYPVKTVLFNGMANWEGVYGLSGKFEGWFSDDDARIPIKAKMKVLVGSVTIELTKWNRKGWIPPKA